MATKAKQKLLLIASEKMATNKKRNESDLIRMPHKARNGLGLENTVEVWPTMNKTIQKTKNVKTLNIFHAFSEDVATIETRIKDGLLPHNSINRIGFVTPSTFYKICGEKPTAENFVNSNIWISEKTEDILLGADPEFLLFAPDGSVIDARTVLSHNGKLASDGPMAEIRPDPEKNPTDLVENMKKIFADKNMSASINDCIWKAACYYKDDNRDYPVGGHIHIGNTTQVANLSGNTKTNFFIVLNKILDELLAVPMVKLDYGENGSERRCDCGTSLDGNGYGFFGNWRPCDGRLEHRTLSGMWLMNPSIAKAVIGTAKAIVHETLQYAESKNFSLDYLSLNETLGKGVWSANYNGWKDIPLAKDMNCIASSKNIKMALNTSDATKIDKTFLGEWIKKMRNMTVYKKHNKFIEGFYEILSIPKEELKQWDRDLKTNWLENRKFIVEV